MRRFGLICTIAFILAAGAAWDNAWTAQAGRDPSNTRQIFTTIVDTPNGIVTTTDLGQPGDSMGDIVVFEAPLLDESREIIGTNSGFCIRTHPGEFSECQWTLALAGGTITVAGREADRGKSMISISGGTGAFSGATGEMASTPNDDGTFTQVLMLRLP